MLPQLGSVVAGGCDGLSNNDVNRYVPYVACVGWKPRLSLAFSAPTSGAAAAAVETA